MPSNSASYIYPNDARRGAADSGEYRQAAGAVKQALIPDSTLNPACSYFKAHVVAVGSECDSAGLWPLSDSIPPCGPIELGGLNHSAGGGQ
jgi:hypothetical protein